MPVDPNLEKEIFLAAVEKAPAERTPFLERACDTDAALLDRVRALLLAHEESRGILGQPATAGSGSLRQEPEESAAESKPQRRPAESDLKGQVIAGRFKLLQKLGAGGMGEVWMAEQREPVKRLVAFKIIKTGRDTQQTLVRFEAERQALAMMDHPNIAKVLDGGTTEAGQPYFVMELVKGIAITKYCDQEQLTPQQRLQLFIPVCQAVQHAHQKGVIHRDLKPSNILIALYDGNAVPKVIDFGIAKAINQKLSDQTMYTEVGQIVGTLEYMPPEQAELNNLDIDTRADVYSLGVVLYELLTGATPFTARQLRDAGILEMLRIIREVDPPKPSTRISTSATLLAIAANRKLEPKRLTSLVAGDLDWIVMKCLRKERVRRYDTANGLALDIQRYLADEPVEASPPSAGYRMRKFVRRNRGPVLASLLVLLAVLGGIVGTTWGLFEAQRQRDHAEQARQDEAEQRRAAVVERDRAENESRLNETELERASHALNSTQVWRAAGIWNREPDQGLELLLDNAICPPEMRDFTWRLYHRLCLCERRELQGHTDIVSCLAVSQDGQWLASGSFDGTVKLWRLPEGRLEATLPGHKDHVWCVAFSPDGKTLASGSRDQTAILWDVRSAKPLKTLDGHVGPVWCLAWAPDSKWIGCGSGSLNPEIPGDARWERGQVVLWDAGSGTQRVLLKEGKSAILSLAVAPDGKTLAAGTATESLVKLFDPRTDKYLGSFHPSTGWIQGLTFVGNSTLAVGSANNTVTLWDRTDDQKPASYAMRQELRGHVGEVWWIAASADGSTLVSTGSDYTLRLWDVLSGQERLSLRNVHVRRGGLAAQGDEPTLAAVLSPDGKLLSAARKTSIRQWTLPGEPFKTTRESHELGVLGLATSPDGGAFASASQDFTVKLWSFPTLREMATCAGHKERVTSVAYSPDGKMVASGSWDNTVKLWQADDGKLVKTLTGHKAEVVAVAYSGGGQLFSASIDGSVFQWDVDAAAPAQSFGPQEGGVSTLALSRDGKTLAVAGNFNALTEKESNGKLRFRVPSNQPGKVTLWDVAGGQKLRTLIGPRRAVVSLAFRDDGLLATASWDGTVTLWNSATGAEVASLPKQDYRVNALAFSHDGKTLAVGGDDRTVQLWDVGSAPRSVFQRAVLKGHDRETTCLAFGKDDQYLVSGSGVLTRRWFVKGGAVLVWDARK